MIVPAFNEEVTIVDSVTNLVHCDYPRFEVVVVNDGSSDATLDRLQARLQAPPHRRAVSRGDRHGAGAGALRVDGAAAEGCPSAAGDRQGERRQGGRAQRGGQRLDGAVLRLPRRRLDPRPARAEGDDAGHPGGPAGGGGRRAGRHRQRLHHPERPGGQRGAAEASAGPVPDGRIPPVVHHRTHRARPARLDPDPVRACSPSSRRKRSSGRAGT